MNTLILYASQSGTAQKAAGMLAELVPGSTVCDLNGAVPSLEGFDCVALGGGVRMGRWHKLATRYACQHADELLARRLGLFVCSGTPDGARELLQAQGLPEALLRSAVAVEGLGGELVLERLHGMEKLMVRMISKQENNPFHTDGVSPERVRRLAEALLGEQTA